MPPWLMAIIKWSTINQIEWPYGALCVQRDEWSYGALCVLRDEWRYKAHCVQRDEWPYEARCVQRDEWPYRARCVLQDEWPYRARCNMEAIMHDFSKPKIWPFVKRSMCLVNNLSTLWKKSECLVKIRMPYEKSECLRKSECLEKSECLMKKSKCLGENPNALCKIQVPCVKSKCLVKKFKCLKNLNALWKIQVVDSIGKHLSGRLHRETSVRETP